MLSNRVPLRALATLVFLVVTVAGCADVYAPDPQVSDAYGPAATGQGQGGAASLAPASAYSAEIPVAYYELSLLFSKRTAGFSPPVQSRAYAYMGLALYEALVAGMPGRQPIAGQLNGVGPLPAAGRLPYEWPLVANAALAEVMRGLWGGATNQATQNVADLDALEAAFEAAYSENHPPGLIRHSIEFGRAVGAAVFETSKDDGGHQGYLTNFPAYTPPVGPGLWVPTVPGQQALQPYWGSLVATFVLANAAECDPGSPPSYSEIPGSAFHDEALEVYELVNNQTPEQLTIARFWADGPGSISGPGHSLAITNQILIQEGADLALAAETYARVGIANADAVTSLWWTKYNYNVLRPVTYVRNVIDPAWELPALPSPPFPEYTSAHSAQSAAAAASLEYLFGTNVAFVDHAHDGDGFEPRPFASIFAAAEEAGMSRLYAGIHFRSGNLQGQAQGRCVAAKVHDLDWQE